MYACEISDILRASAMRAGSRGRAQELLVRGVVVGLLELRRVGVARRLAPQRLQDLVSRRLERAVAEVEHRQLAGAAQVDELGERLLLHLHADADRVHVLLPQRVGFAIPRFGQRAAHDGQRLAVRRLAVAVAVAVLEAEAVEQRARAGRVVERLRRAGSDRGRSTPGGSSWFAGSALPANSTRIISSTSKPMPIARRSAICAFE